MERFEKVGEAPPRKPVTVAELLRRPTISWELLKQLVEDVPDLEPAVAEQVETDIKYAGYLARVAVRAERKR